MFKSGDDLRQDQLIMQLMMLMDGLLKKVNLDLKLLTYRVLAITQNDGKDYHFNQLFHQLKYEYWKGIMEFVQNSHAVSAILAEYK
jgi:phosphatidylinositol 3-kinase